MNYSVNQLVTDVDVESLAGDFKSIHLYGNDSVNAVGNYSNNTIIGNDADNIIDGLPGADTLTGGMGSDRFVYSNAFDSFMGSSNPILIILPILILLMTLYSCPTVRPLV